ncbi:ATP-binding cassette domain-containing protein [Dellaglioa sp. L3N]
MIEFVKVNKQYDTELALKDLSLTINDGELFVLVGPSGSGKTTLLKMINQLITPTTGKILIDNQDASTMDLEQLRRSIGYVLQTGALFPNMTVEQNASLQLEVLGYSRADQLARVSDLLQQVGLDPALFLQRMPHELSGGEAQRVGIVRALATKPKLVLMDEPFSALDPLSRQQLQQIITQLHAQLDVTFIFVTHDMREALKLGSRLAVMKDGILQQVGTPHEILTHPNNKFVAEFFRDEQEETTVASLLSLGLGESSSEKATEPLTETTTLAEIAQKLQQHPSVIVTTTQGNLKITTDDLLAYLARGHD